MNRTTPLICILSLLLAAPGLAGDLDSERLVAATLSQAGDLTGEVVTLTAGDGDVIGVHRVHQRGAGRGAVILLHGPWGHPDDPGVMRPLRLGLADAGWTTLSLLLPRAYRNAPSSAWLSEGEAVQARIAAAAAWLKQQGQLNQVIVAQGLAAVPALDFLASGEASDVRALVMLSPLLAQGSSALNALGEIDIPVLDIIAERDRAAVRANLPLRRRIAAENPTPAWTAREVPAVPHDYRGAGDALLASVRAWLAANVDGQTVPAEQQ